MRRAEIYYLETLAGELLEDESSQQYLFTYNPDYSGPPISLTMPLRDEPYNFDTFPPFFDGLLPEGYQLEALLRTKKLDRNDHFAQLLLVGTDTVGAVTVREAR